MMKLLEKKVVVVTGSGRGIGAAIATRCGQEGAKVVINYLSQTEKAEATLKAIQEQGGEGIVVQADVRQEESVELLLRRVISTYGGLDILVNCAHTPFQSKLFADLVWKDVAEQFDGTFGNVFHCIKKALPFLEKSSSAAILNISSVTVRVPEVDFIHRSVAKAAIEGLTRSLAIALAPQKIRVNALSVGWTQTDQVKQFPQEYILQKTAKIPLGRLATPFEIADTALYLISSMSSYVTGTVFPVTGGLYPDVI